MTIRIDRGGVNVRYSGCVSMHMFMLCIIFIYINIIIKLHVCFIISLLILLYTIMRNKLLFGFILLD